jgi:ADP-ribose pyrophosphatase YjhB (NUDIX family)
MNQIICTVDVVLLTLQDNALKVALLERKHAPFQAMLALPGGYIHADEDIDAKHAALRVLRSKAHVTPPYLEQLATFSGPARDPRGWSASIIYYALVSWPAITEASVAKANALASAPSNPSASTVLQLVDISHLPALPFDHAQIIATAVERLRSKSQYSSLPCYLAGEEFTLPQLQRVYEALMGEALNKVSFRRKMTEMAMLEEVGRFEPAGAHRPAQLYRLKPEFRQQLTLLERGL